MTPEQAVDQMINLFTDHVYKNMGCTMSAYMISETLEDMRNEVIAERDRKGAAG